jgi:hypothetical protein
MKEGGDEAQPEAQEDVAKDEEEPLKEEEKEEDKEEEKEEEEKEEDRIEDHMCCCCICHCQDEKSRPHSCCGCFPIKCGLITIGIFTLLITLALFIEVFYCLLNEYIHWWYVPVAVLCLCPLIVAAVFVIRFFTKD